MKNTVNAQLTNGGIYELRLITKGVGFLALVTGVLYLRVVVAEELAAIRADDIVLETILLIAFLFAAVLGLLLAWRWEGAGGLIALLGGAGLALLDYSINDRNRWFAAFLYSSPFVIAGGLCLICWWRRRTIDESMHRPEW